MPKWTDSLKAAIGNTVLTIFVKVGMRPKQIFQIKTEKIAITVNLSYL